MLLGLQYIFHLSFAVFCVVANYKETNPGVYLYRCDMAWVHNWAPEIKEGYQKVFSQ